MSENNTENYENDILEDEYNDPEQELYYICSAMAYRRDFSKIARLNMLLESFPVDSSFAAFKILLFYIYYILLRADEREVLSNVKTYVIKTLICIQDQMILSKTAGDPYPDEELTIEERYIEDFTNLILNKYNPDWGQKIEDFDYNKIHQFNVFVYKTQFCKFRDYFLSLCFLWGGLYMNSCPYISQYDKDLFLINCEDIIKRIPDPYNEEFKKLKKEAEEDAIILERANQINLY